MKIFKKITGVFMAAVMAVTAMPLTASAAVSLPDNEAMRFVDNMGAIWNLGNCFDAANCSWLSNEMDYETAWCGAKVTEKLIKAIKDKGFDSIRIPVSWHDHVDSNYNISEQWMDRVYEVVDWSLDEGLYVIINIHHDIEKEYYYTDSAHYENSEKFVKKIWAQVSEEFKDCSEKLVFELSNEPRLKGTNNEWWFNVNNPSSEVADSIDCINKLNQVSLDTIRKSGGNNKNRYILVGGYDTSVDGVTVSSYKLPKDTVKNRLIVDFHMYTKSKSTYTWTIDKIYSTYTSKGIPAILSEYNIDANNNAYKDWHTEYLAELVSYARERGISCAIWDNNDVAYKIIDRASVKWTQDAIAKAIVKAGKPAMKGSSSSSSSSTSSSPSVSAADIDITAKQDGFYVNLSWNKVSGASKYRVYRSTSKTGKKTRIKETSSTSCISTSCDVGGTYYFYVKSYDKNSKKWSDYSDPVKLSVKKSKAVTELTAKKDGTNKAKLSWDKVDGAKKYIIYYSRDGKTFKKLNTVSAGKLSSSVSGLNYKKYDYTFAVVAVDGDGNKSNLSNKVKIK